MDAAFDRAREGLAAAGDVRGLAAALAERARWLRTTTCYPEEALRSSREALELLDRAGIGAPETRLIAMAGLAWGEAVAGDPVRGEQLLAEVDAMSGVMEDTVLRAELVLARGFALVRAGHSAEARRRCAEGALLAEQAGRPALALDARIGEAACAAAQGRIADVLTVLESVPDPVRTGPGLACQSWAGRAHALSRLGSHAEAVDAAEEELRVARRFGSPELEEAAEADLGLALLAAGRGAEALAALEVALAGEAGRVPRAALRLAAAEASLVTGNLSGARAHLDHFPFEPVGPADDPVALIARLDRVTGLLGLAEGDTETGLRHLAAAEERLRQIIEDVRSDEVAGEELLAVMLDLGRPPVAGVSDHAGELARVSEERAPGHGGGGRRRRPCVVIGFREGIVCAAPPADVWRLVHDPSRMSEWMTDTERVEAGNAADTVTRYLHGWPDHPMPTRVSSQREGSRVIISCLVSDIDFRVALSPDPGGCRVDIDVSLPDAEAARLGGVRTLVADSLARLAERSASGTPLG